MKKTKLEKGITLIALIITIIILLILAVVTIGSIKNSNIITYAQNASDDYNREKSEEIDILDSYEKLIEDNIESEFKKFVIDTLSSMEKNVNGKYYNLTTLKNKVKQKYPSAFIELNANGMGIGKYEDVFSEEKFEQIVNDIGESEWCLNILLNYEKDLFYVDINGKIANYQGAAVPMKESEAENLFTYKAATSSEIENPRENDIIITGYIGKDTTVKIPAVLYDENGNVTKTVVGIGEATFGKGNGIKTLYISLCGMSEKDYKEKTIKEIWDTLFDETYTGNSVSGNSADLTDKKTALIEAFDSMGVGKNMYEFDENDMLYVWVGADKNVIPRPTIDIEKVYIPLWVSYIGDSAFADQTKLTTIFAGLETKISIASNAFNGCTSLKDIYIRLKKETIQEMEGSDTKWGAPSSTVLYYVEEKAEYFMLEYDKNIYTQYT